MDGLCGMERGGERRGEHRVLVGKPEGKKPLGKPRRRYEDDIKISLMEVGLDCVDWIDKFKDDDM